MVKGMGGAMDLVSGAGRVIVLMEHVAKTGAPKLVADVRPAADRPPGRGHRVITDLGVLDVAGDGFELVELAPGVTRRGDHRGDRGPGPGPGRGLTCRRPSRSGEDPARTWPHACAVWRTCTRSGSSARTTARRSTTAAGTTWSSCFTPDGAFVGLSTARGHDELRTFFSDLQDGPLSAWWHFSSNETIDLVGTPAHAATGATWLDQPCVVDGRAHVAAGRYQDQMVRGDDGRWRFAERQRDVLLLGPR